MLTFLAVATAAAAVIVSLAPASRMMRTEPARAARGDSSLDPRRSRLRSALVAAQVGASVLFLIGAVGLTTQFRRLPHKDLRIDYDHVSLVRVTPELRPSLARRLAGDPAVEAVAVTWKPPLMGTLPMIQARASTTGASRPLGFMVVSPAYFTVFHVAITSGRPLRTTTREQVPQSH